VKFSTPSSAQTCVEEAVGKIFICIYVCAYLYMYMSISICVCLCMHKCMCTYVYKKFSTPSSAQKIVEDAVGKLFICIYIYLWICIYVYV
jgi:hypothetical protein